MTLWSGIDRRQLLRFLEETGGARSLLPGSDSYLEDQEVHPYTGWFGVDWEGATIEVVLAPRGRTAG